MRLPISDYYQLTSYLAPFLRYDLRKLHNRYIWLPLLHLILPTEGFPWDDLRKIFRGCRQMAQVRNGEETLRKILTGST